MKLPPFTETLTEAEKACRAAIEEAIGSSSYPVYRFANPGVTDCAVFDIGYSATGDLNLCNAESYHWRGTLTLYCRDHDALQNKIMLLVSTLPINHNINSAHALRNDSNVIMLRVAPEARAISAIETTTVTPPNSKEIPVYSCEIACDVIFAAR